jgi:hypothetical protein
MQRSKNAEQSQYYKYDRARRLGALQSLMILLLMQAEDADSIEKNSATLLLETVTVCHLLALFRL